MNQKLQQELDQLVTEMKKSEEYLRFQKIQAKVADIPGLQQQIDDFREIWYRLQQSNDVDLFEKIDHVEMEYAAFRENPFVQEYLAAELAVCRMVQKVNWTILANLDFDTSFLTKN